MSGLDESRRARVRGERIGFVFQAYNLLPRQQAYRQWELPLIYAGVRRASEGRVWPRRWSRWGSQIDSAIDRTSSAVKQRVGIARALVVRPSSLADEPTGLDSASADEVLGLLELLNRQGTTVVLVTHSEEVAHTAAHRARRRRPDRVGRSSRAPFEIELAG